MEILHVKDFPAAAHVIHDPEHARCGSHLGDGAPVTQPATVPGLDFVSGREIGASADFEVFRVIHRRSFKTVPLA
jgi:hypothetical protein